MAATFVAVSLAVTGFIMRADPQNILVGRIFYVGISVINLLLVSVFWSFLLELFQSEQTKRLFGFIAAGGTTGALVGPVLTSLFVTRIGNEGVLYLGAGMFIVAVFLQRLLMAQWHSVSPGGAGANTQPSAEWTATREGRQAARLARGRHEEMLHHLSAQLGALMRRQPALQLHAMGPGFDHPPHLCDRCRLPRQAGRRAGQGVAANPRRRDAAGKGQIGTR
jgi:MFS family permease